MPVEILLYIGILLCIFFPSFIYFHFTLNIVPHPVARTCFLPACSLPSPPKCRGNRLVPPAWLRLCISSQISFQVSKNVKGFVIPFLHICAIVFGYSYSYPPTLPSATSLLPPFLILFPFPNMPPSCLHNL